VTLTVAATGATGTCGGVAGTWTATPWTGSSPGNGNPFTLDTPPIPSTTISPLCYTVSTAKTGNGTITTPNSSVASGAKPVFTVTPDLYNSIASVAGTGCSVTKTTGDGKFATSTYTAAPVTANCTVTANFVPNTLTITSQPTSAAVNDPFDVKVGISPTGGAVTADTGACGTVSQSQSTAVTGTPTTFTFTITTPPANGSCTIVFTAPNYATRTLSSLKVYNGVLGCGGALQDISATGGAPVDSGTGLDPITGLPVPGWAAGSRGVNDKGEPCSTKVNYTFTNNVLGGNSTNLEWDVNAVPGAAFKYTINWKPEYVDGTTGMPSQRTKVKWLGLNAPVALVLGRACIAQNQDPSSKDFLPRPYGTLDVVVNNSDGFISVTPATGVTLPTPPFAITIGSERMLVSAVVGTTWTVVRGDGSTPPATHPASAYVMSNPLPVYYPIGTTPVQMQMCIADEGFAIVPPGSADCNTTPSTPTSCAAVTTTIYDIGDGSVGRGAL